MTPLTTDAIARLRTLAHEGHSAAVIASRMGLSKLDVVRACGTYGVSIGRINDHLLVGAGETARRKARVKSDAKARRTGFGAKDTRADDAGTLGCYVEYAKRKDGSSLMRWSPGRRHDPDVLEEHPYLFAEAAATESDGLLCTLLWEPTPRATGPVAPGPRRKSPTWGSTGKAQKKPRGVLPTNMPNAPIACGKVRLQLAPDDPREMERQRKNRVAKRERRKRAA